MAPSSLVAEDWIPPGACQGGFAARGRDGEAVCVFPEAEGEAIEREATELAAFLRENAEAIARTAAASLVGGTPVFGAGVRRRLRTELTDQVLELARHLASYGFEGPRLYGESQRRYAAARLAEGMQLHDALQERAAVEDAIYQVWRQRGSEIPVTFARLLAMAAAEVGSQTAEVWLTYQRAESVAFQEAALLETIVHHLDEAILVVEPDGVVSYATPALEEIVGLPAHVFVGLSPDRMDAILAPIDLRDREGRPIEYKELPHMKALATREVHHADFVRLRRADGSEAVCELYAAPVFAEGDQLRGVILTVRDRTEVFRQHEALEKALEELRRMHARLLARSRLEAIGELSGSTAHALNNQLNVITLRLRRLLERPESAPDAEAIRRSVREIANIVARLQEFAAAPSPAEAVPTDPRRAVASALELMRARVGPTGEFALEKRIEDVPRVWADAETLIEILTALLLGAEDATPPDTAVELELVREGDEVVLRVVDRGPTLDADQIAQLFDPLVAEERERALNFAVTRQALERWGGSIRVLPAEGGGNVVELRMRVVREEKPERAEAPPPAEAPRRAIERVLVVDDDPDNAAMLADLVRDAAAEARTARTGGEALEVAGRFRPQAALVDLLLPDMPGWDVVRVLRERFPDARIAVVSGLAVGKEEQAGSGADVVFRKPIDTEALLRFLGA